jgi:hypothetical protein
MNNRQIATIVGLSGVIVCIAALATKTSELLAIAGFAIGWALAKL